MSEATSAEGVWRPVDYEESWAPFDARFDFKPDYYERKHPAIRLPEHRLVVDLAPVFGHGGPRVAAGGAAIDAAALGAFVRLAGDSDMVALDWQHAAYHYSPAAHVLADVEWPIPVVPNGDYYIHMIPDLS